MEFWGTYHNQFISAKKAIITNTGIDYLNFRSLPEKAIRRVGHNSWRKQQLSVDVLYLFFPDFQVSPPSCLYFPSVF